MIYIYGGGGRAKLIKEILIRLKTKSKDIKFIDDYEKKYNNTTYLLKNFNIKKDKLYLGISDPKLQKKKYTFFKSKLKKIDNDPLIDPSAILKSNINIGNNVIILENASIGPKVQLDNNVFVGANSIINHDCEISAFTTIGHGSNLAGNVMVNKYCYIGISSVFKQNIIIEENVKIGCGSNIVKRCKKNSTYFGNPAKKFK